MKKKFFTSLLIVLVLIMFPLLLGGCNDVVHSVDEFDSLYTSIKTDKETSQFFDGDNLTVNFNTIDVNNRNDKSYIFGGVYSYYLKSSSRLFSGVIKNQPKPSFILRNFKQEEITNLYNKLEDVKYKLLNFSESKKVYEKTDSHIYYKNFINDYNALINSLFNFNTTFADAYFSSVGKVDFSNNTVSDRNIKDYIAYQLMQVSKVSFSYELVPFKISNPLGEVNTYIENTTQVKNFITLANMAIIKIDSSQDVTPSGTNQTALVDLFVNLQNYSDKYNNECNKFLIALDSFNMKAYHSQDDKQTYLQNCSAVERSSFNIIQNFLDGRYKAVVGALTQAVSILKI